MKKFLLKTGGFLFLCFLFGLAIFTKADGKTDAFYIRFTSPKQSSLIIGTSRSAQGIIPSVLNQHLKRKDLFNYSFTVTHSPYGPTYYQSILKKLDTNTRNGLFILAVDPWSISSVRDNPDDSTAFPETSLFLADNFSVHADPNVEYLLYHFADPYYKLIYNRESTRYNTYLHRDGWLEVNVNMKDSAYITRNIKMKIDEYRKDFLPKYRMSNKRLEYLSKTIVELRKHGDVFLVRLPVHPEMMAIENSLMPDFNARIRKICTDQIGYYDMTGLNGKLQFTDGNHLYKDSGRLVSQLIAEWIANSSSNNSKNKFCNL